eukprot:scaffold36955_cov69-Phaeocystis_antarctica.AAC.5
MKPTHASEAHVAAVRGLSASSSSSSSSLPHEDISPILIIAPTHVLSETGVRAEARPHSEAVLSTLILR